MRHNDAVAPVVAAILILAVVVTLISAFQVTVVPAMKERSEMEHIAGVEMALLRFSSHIETAAAMKQPLVFSETIQLGGGDTLLNSIKSGGTLYVMNDGEKPLAQINITNHSHSTISNITLINFSYSPVGNYWRDQGYDWRWGVMNVSSGGRETPLIFPTMQVAEESILNSGFPGSLITIKTDWGLIPERFDNGTITGNLIEHISIITIDRVAYSAGNPDFTSGNANTRLALSAKINETRIFNVTELGFRVPDNTLIPESFRYALNNSLGHQLSSLNPTFSQPTWTISFTGHLPDLILRETDIRVTAG
ncbi:MAG: hypothetical protein Q7J09_09560 [Methanocalculus sp.]|uniref:hypothetical protein n=1 Tax=Methanocalculus sp. TaxID=2004547 RepID=UPI002717AACC|nr:hypothetical protein [Methanocalculus sp.]MDO9540230.1 hypothetical protein [Methanocalculus sp.]